jgi:hypothetical protein
MLWISYFCPVLIFFIMSVITCETAKENNHNKFIEINNNSRLSNTNYSQNHHNILKQKNSILSREPLRQLQFYGERAYPPIFYNSYATGISPMSIWPPYGGMKPYGPGFNNGYPGGQFNRGRSLRRFKSMKPGMASWRESAQYYRKDMTSRYLISLIKLNVTK